MGLVITCLLWRAPFFWMDLYRNNTSPRALVLYHFFMLFVDLIDIPFIFATVLVTVTVWRGVHFWKHTWPQKIKIHSTTGVAAANTHSIYGHPKRTAWRKHITFQFLYWCADIPTAFLALLVTLSVYRGRYMWRDLVKVCCLYCCYCYCCYYCCWRWCCYCC